MMPIPRTASQWVYDQSTGLELEEGVPIPDLKEGDCLLQIHAVSLNYGEVARMKGKYPQEGPQRRVAGGDGVATVIATGSGVTEFQAGDRVCPIWQQTYQTGPLTPEIENTALGLTIDGTLREYAVLAASGLVKAPTHLTHREAATLTCAAVTAWNGLCGLSERRLKAGDWVLTQGTGAVSLAAVQFAVAAGAHVVVTTSTTEKAKFLKSLGVEHVLNYRENPSWGESAKALTPGGRGFHHIIELGGQRSLRESLQAVRCEGVVSLIGLMEELETIQNTPGITFPELFLKYATVRSLHVGSRQQFQEMVDFMEQHAIRPVVNEEEFKFEDCIQAYEKVWEGGHTGKIVVNVSSA
ncbi:hypothetical protein ABZX51_005995 [Aspergillus tubingensis]